METKHFKYNPDRSILTKEDIFSGYTASSEQLMNYVNELSDVDLTKSVSIKEEYFSCNFEKYHYLQHLINHGFYHRGQIVTMGRTIGITDAPMTDYNFYKVVSAHNHVADV